MPVGSLARMSGSELCAATTSVDETRSLARALAGRLVVGDVLVLAGDLGAGKTAFTQGLARGLGVDEPVTSPTFTIASRYDGDELVLHHLDVYRLDDVAETLDLDLPDLMDSGVTVIEWGEQILDALPADRLVIRLAYGDGDDDRVLRFEGGSSWTQRLVGLPGVGSC